MFISVEEIDRFIKEDVPYIDLTSWSLGIHGQSGKICYFAREDMVACGTEEVCRIFERLDIKTELFVTSGTHLQSGDELISGMGRGDAVHMAWKVGLNILEYCSGISSKTAKMVKEVKKVNPNIPILTTRKGFPGTKALAIKAIMMGGAVPHRLGLSETVLVFKQHIDLIGGFDVLLTKIPELKKELCEKKIIVETRSFDEARMLCVAGADGIQFDKILPDVLKDIIAKLKVDFPHIIFLAAGGINEKNIVAYAGTNIDGIVTTSLYNAKSSDIGVDIKLRQGE